MGLFSKKETEAVVVDERSAFDKAHFHQWNGTDEEAEIYIEEIKSHEAVVINFKDTDIEGANRILWFMTGALYALDGETVKINKYVYLFALKSCFDDGSLYQFLERQKNK